MAEFLAMGGYAAFIWPAYGVAVVILVGLLVSSLRGLRAREAVLRALESESGLRPAGRRRGRSAPADEGSPS